MLNIKIYKIEELTYQLSYNEKLEFLKYMYARKKIKIENNKFEYLLSGMCDEEILDIFEYLLKEMDLDDKINILKYMVKVYIKGIWYGIKKYLIEIRTNGI